ncbi:hypothetical protein AVEN_261569-1 [Araneus ventricosus]|uniref:Uncharacterized protein n=1 Tax=Araneus ventricosus TaxID=182803 RepID=A0A4Y2E977_ARAVE|nr:hypothetical protein AVEN_261569-1 [Araneus ventricosus]
MLYFIRFSSTRCENESEAKFSKVANALLHWPRSTGLGTKSKSTPLTGKSFHRMIWARLRLAAATMTNDISEFGPVPRSLKEKAV